MKKLADRMVIKHLKDYANKAMMKSMGGGMECEVEPEVEGMDEDDRHAIAENRPDKMQMSADESAGEMREIAANGAEPGKAPEKVTAGAEHKMGNSAADQVKAEMSDLESEKAKESLYAFLKGSNKKKKMNA